jgi:ABC-type Zn uptake system ZnuABC Zn-binding protein ZnuA
MLNWNISLDQIIESRAKLSNSIYIIAKTKVTASLLRRLGVDHVDVDVIIPESQLVEPNSDSSPRWRLTAA